MSERKTIKKIVKNFTSLQYELVIYYHPELDLSEISKRASKKHPALKDFNIDEITDNDGAVTISPEGERRIYLIINRNLPIGIAHHEAIHITTRAFQLSGSVHTEETDELYAFHSQEVFELLIQLMIKKFKVPIENMLVF
jgi:hypothetical protein